MIVTRYFLLSIALSCFAAGHAYGQQREVNFDYAPAWWMTPIGFVDDWQKSTVLNDGALAYDFGPGPYAEPTTTIFVGLDGADGADGAELEHTQKLFDSKVPIVQTLSEADGISISTEALAVVPALVSATPIPVKSDRGFKRKNGLTGSIAWATPGSNVDPVFRSVAWGTGRSILYEIDVAQNSAHQVALGFAEAHRSGRIVRELEMRVEGSSSRVVDLMQIGEKNQPHVFFFEAVDSNGDGKLRVEVAASARTQDPNTILSGIWLFGIEQDVTEDDVISGRGSQLASLVVNSGWELEQNAGKPRVDLLRAVIDRTSNAGTEPVVFVRSRQRIDTKNNGVFDGEGRPFFRVDPLPIAIEAQDDGYILRFAPDTDTLMIAVAHGVSQGSPFPNIPDFERARSEAIKYWFDRGLPWSTIQVPDPGIQGLLDGSVRTIYQVREVVDGFAQFQPGPSVYRGLWYGDATWSVEAVAYAGDTLAARLATEAMIAHQDSTGRAGVMSPPLLHRETAHMIYAICRYAKLSGDRRWLQRNWHVVAQAMQHLTHLREIALEDPDALYYGLFPPGLTDGGVGGINPEYGSTYWGLIAMSEAVRTASWLGDPVAGSRWGKEREAFLAAFWRTAERDMRRDEAGNVFLPVLMNFDPDKNVPQRGQWGVMHAFYAGQFLQADDSLLVGTLAMLERNTVEDHAVSVGWLTGGIWPIFEAHRALVYNRLGDAERTINLLYAIANHASPTGVWVEEQMPKGSSGQGQQTTGDIPHTIGNVQIIRLVRNMLATEVDDHIWLFSSLPSSWLKDGARIALQDAPTEFGPLDLELTIEADQARLRLAAPAAGIQIRMQALIEAGFRDADGNVLPESIRVAAGESKEIRFIKP
jgi:hypothetical protein